jgi:putative ABC transport system permease protein
LLFGLFPAWRASKVEISETLKTGAARGSGSIRSARVLLSFQVALTVLLLVVTGTLTMSFLSLAGRDPGFDPENLLLAQVSLGYPGAERLNNLNERIGFESYEERASLYRSILEGIRGLPQVEDAAVACCSVPLHFTAWSAQWKRTDEGWVGWWYNNQEPLDTVRWLGNGVSPNYFEVLGVPLVKGTTFADWGQQAEPSIVISRSMADRLWPGEDPLDKTVETGMQGRLRVRGVVEDLAASVEDVMRVTDRRFSNQVYFSATHDIGRDVFLIVRARPGTEPLSLLPAVEEHVARVQPHLPVHNATTMEAVVARTVARPRFYMLLMLVFAGEALALSLVGIHALVSRSVRNSWREIGIRTALGARQHRILGLMARQAMAPAAAGALAGMLLALAVLKSLERLLYGMEPYSAALLLAVCGAVLAVAFCSSVLPAFRALRVDPSTILRQE